MDRGQQIWSWYEDIYHCPKDRIGLASLVISTLSKGWKPMLEVEVCSLWFCPGDRFKNRMK
jgi:hypothetical protein